MTTRVPSRRLRVKSAATTAESRVPCASSRLVTEAGTDWASQIVHGSPVPAFVIDRDHRVTHWNRALESLSHIGAESVVGTSRQWSAFYPEPRPVLADLILDRAPESEMRRLYADRLRPSELIEGAYEAEGFFPSVGPDGGWLYFTAAPLRDAQGEIHAVVETLQDFTATHRAEEALRVERANLAKRLREMDCLYGISRLKDDPELSTAEFLQRVTELIPASWQYPEVAGAAIRIDDIEVATADLSRAVDEQHAVIKVGGQPKGLVRVAYLKPRRPADEGPFLAEERKLLDGIAREIGVYLERVRAKESLLLANAELDTERQALFSKNVALREVLSQIEAEKLQTARQIQTNVDRVVLPLVHRLRDRADPNMATYLDILQRHLQEVTDPFTRRLESRDASLTPRELQICNMIRDGLTSGEIARILDVSIETVRSQRKNVRRKLGLAGASVNLATFLQTV